MLVAKNAEIRERHIATFKDMHIAQEVTLNVRKRTFFDIYINTNTKIQGILKALSMYKT